MLLSRNVDARVFLTQHTNANKTTESGHLIHTFLLSPSFCFVRYNQEQTFLAAITQQESKIRQQLDSSISARKRARKLTPKEGTPSISESVQLGEIDQSPARSSSIEPRPIPQLVPYSTDLTSALDTQRVPRANVSRFAFPRLRSHAPRRGENNGGRLNPAHRNSCNTTAP